METPQADIPVKKARCHSPSLFSDEESPVTSSGRQVDSFSPDQSRTVSTTGQRLGVCVEEEGKVQPPCSESEAPPNSGSWQRHWKDRVPGTSPTLETGSLQASGRQNVRSEESQRTVSSDNHTCTLQAESEQELFSASQSQGFLSSSAERGTPCLIVETLFRCEVTDRVIHYISMRDGVHIEMLHCRKPSGGQQQDIGEEGLNHGEVESDETALFCSQQDLFPSEDGDETPCPDKVTHSEVSLDSQRVLFHNTESSNIMSSLNQCNTGTSQSGNTYCDQADNGMTSEDMNTSSPLASPDELHGDEPESEVSSLSSVAVLHAQERGDTSSSQTESSGESDGARSACNQMQSGNYLYSSLPEATRDGCQDSVSCRSECGSGRRERVVASETDSPQLNEGSEEMGFGSDSDILVATPEFCYLPGSAGAATLCGSLLDQSSSAASGSSQTLSAPPTPVFPAMAPGSPALSQAPDCSSEVLGDDASPENSPGCVKGHASFPHCK